MSPHFPIVNAFQHRSTASSAPLSSIITNVTTLVHISNECCISCPGFTGDFWRAYHELIPKAPLFDKRKELYLLYHYLNHTNLFGGKDLGYNAYV